MKKRVFILLNLSLISISGCVMSPMRTEAPAVTEERPVASSAVASAPVMTEASAAEVDADGEPLTKFSDANNMAPPSDRSYKRMTREKMEEESELYGSAGSLWKMEGQTSYLFAENKHRRHGDATSIKMDGPALKLIENKVAVVQELLVQLEEQKKKAEEESKKAEEEKQRLAEVEEQKKVKAEMIAKGDWVEDPFEGQYPQDLDRKPAAVAEPVAVANKEPKKEEKIDLKEIDLIPSKVVEKLSDGLYRIRGQQFLTIKKKPYKVIATALVREEDFNDTAVSSSKLLDAQYDVIHVKRTAE